MAAAVCILQRRDGMDFLTAVYTDIGSREKNQDSVLLEIAAAGQERILLGVICDGMGGLARGEAASGALVRAFSDWFHKTFPRIFYRGMEVQALKQSWMELLQKQNRRIRDYGQSHNILLGTTATALLLAGNNYYVIHAGDSRAYYLREGIQQITKDQTFVQREVELGRISPEEARIHPEKHLLLQCIGAGPAVEPDFYTGEYQKDGVFILCSDGFCHLVQSQELFPRLKPENMTTEGELETAAKYIAELNKSRGEEDNISAALIRTI